MKPSSVTQTLYDHLNYRAQRQRVISANIANIDTPDYKTKELSFKQHLEDSSRDLQLKVTNGMHILPKDDSRHKQYNLYEVKGLPEQNDGNNVNLDTQMSEMAKNNVIFSAIQNSIKKDSAWFKFMIDASSKN